jgi:Ca2+/H+ antiporter, TMEM165/GDT1 family
MWKQLGPTVLASFLASFVEFVEALTIVLAVWTVRGWKPAIAGTAAGTLLLVLVVVLFGPLLRSVPIDALRLVIGLLLLLFGMRWLRKAVLRSAGIVALHDESTAFKEETTLLTKTRGRTWHGIDLVGAGTTFNAVVLEGLEVVFIVVALGATGGMLIPASVGALAAGVLVLLLGLIVHKPLSKVPENTLKFTVGILISAYGVFWVGEGAGFDWWGGDLAIVGIAAMLFLTAVSTIALARRIVSG